MNEITQSEKESLTKATWGVAGPTLTYERNGRPWRDTCHFLALSAYRCSDSKSPAGAPANQVPPDQGGWGPFTPSSGAGRYLQLIYPPSTTKGDLQLGAVYTLWIPDDIKTVRAVIVHQHGASIPAAQAGATSAYDLHWQALAKKWNCVLLGPSYHVLNDAIDLTPGGAELWFDPRQGSERVFLRALNEFATKSGHAEIATVPWCLWGHSGGGIWANVMSILHPDRVLAAFLRSGTAVMFRARPEFIQPEVPPAIYEIPTMVNFGVGERGNRPWDGSIATFQEYRAQGAPIGFAPDPRTGHFCGDSRYRHPVLRCLPSNALNGMEQNLEAGGPEFCMAGTAVRRYSHTRGRIQRGSHEGRVVAECGRGEDLDGICEKWKRKRRRRTSRPSQCASEMCERTLMQITAMRSHGKPKRISSVDSVASLCFEMGEG